MKKNIDTDIIIKKELREEEIMMNKKRGFEIAKGYENMNITLPERKTKNSAGYDIAAAEDCIIPIHKGGKPTLVKTGIKAYFEKDEVLIIANRSSNPMKKGLVLANSIGVIDSDYYGNPDNDGHIMFAFYNMSDKDVQIKKGDMIGQGIFFKFLTTDDDKADGERIGGFGSTGN